MSWVSIIGLGSKDKSKIISSINRVKGGMKVISVVGVVVGVILKVLF